MQVKLIAVTRYLDAWENSPAPESLIVHAGRVCYRSTGTGLDSGTAPGFIRARIKEGHESIIEHASASFEISEISRACSHQLVRHRIASYSQESQRYVDMSNPNWITPPDIAADPKTMLIWSETLEQTKEAYRRLREQGTKKEDARFLLPNATATRIVMSANFRELLHVFRLRISPQAQWEIREVCVRMLEAIYPYAPSVFGALMDQLREGHPEFFADE